MFVLKTAFKQLLKNMSTNFSCGFQLKKIEWPVLSARSEIQAFLFQLV